MIRDAGRTHPAHHPIQGIPNRSPNIFVTVCTHQRAPFLANREAHQILREAWTQAGSYAVGRYMILPDHLHLFCAPSAHYPEFPLKAWVQYWKSLVSRHWPWPENHPLWQRDFWDTQLRTGESYKEKWWYVQQNPVRHGLVEDAEAWPYQGKLHDLLWLEP